MKNTAYVNTFELECSCGCGEFEVSQWKDDGTTFLAYNIPAWYAGSFSGWKKALKIIWNVLRGRQYYLYEIVIEDNEKLKQFKDFVANMKEIDESK